MARTPEGKVKDGVKALLSLRGIYYFMPVSNGMGVMGIPDVIACWKGQFLSIETKAPGKRNTVTVLQQRNIDAINKNGGWAIVVDDPAQLDEFLVSKMTEKQNG